MKRHLHGTRPCDLEVGDVFQEAERDRCGLEGARGPLRPENFSDLLRFRGGGLENPLVDGRDERNESLLELRGGRLYRCCIGGLGIGLEESVIFADNGFFHRFIEGFFRRKGGRDHGVEEPGGLQADVDLIFRLDGADDPREVEPGSAGQTELFAVDGEIRPGGGGELVAPHEENAPDARLFHRDDDPGVGEARRETAAHYVRFAPVGEEEFSLRCGDGSGHEARREGNSRRGESVPENAVIQRLRGQDFRRRGGFPSPHDGHFVQPGDGVHGRETHFRPRDRGEGEHRMGVGEGGPVADGGIFRFRGGEEIPGVALHVHQIFPRLAVEIVDGEGAAEDGKVVALHHVQLHRVKGDGLAKVEDHPVGRFRLVFKVAGPVAICVAGLPVAHRFRTVEFPFVVRREETAPRDLHRTQDLDRLNRIQQQRCRQERKKLFHVSPLVVFYANLRFTDWGRSSTRSTSGSSGCGVRCRWI